MKQEHSTFDSQQPTSNGLLSVAAGKSGVRCLLLDFECRHQEAGE